MKRIVGIRALVVFFVVAAFATPVRAEPAPLPLVIVEEEPWLAIDLALGAGTPVGAFGLWALVFPLPYVSLAVGLESDARENDDDLQLAAMVRGHTAGPWRLGGALGVSFGDFVLERSEGWIGQRHEHAD